ncbi:plasmid replication protein, CyRepA1 family [Moorena sp. SIO4A5]|uniref:plasmid replication protein, CyRepA1 family n=1 Tax=unclassified Moorena TaxID=2683338 RepID=UPI003424F47E
MTSARVFPKPMNHIQEWTASSVDEQLTRLNVRSLEGSSPFEYLFYSDSLPRRNDGRLLNSILKRYQHLEQGGWWCSGIDLLTGQEDIWGCFKPSQPRQSGETRKLIKYEHPPKTPTGLFALRVPFHLWQRIAERNDFTILPTDLDHNQPDLGFWQWLISHPSIPLCITEGAKKAGALLTAGYAAIALPGINGGYRIRRDAQGNRIGKSDLIPQLQKLATPDRPIYIVFDQDSKPNTIKAVNAAIRRMGYLLNQAGCPVKVITWDAQLGKGVDDLIADQGQKTFEQVYQRALPLDTWKAKSLTQLTYGANLKVNCRYLQELPIPDTAQLIGIKSPKGTGKTQLLEKIVSQALARKQWVLVLGHRVRLVEALCQRFGIKYITEVRDDQKQGVLGYGLCLDSLHGNSQARFNAANWSDGVVIIDEVEQVLWHGLNSSTCQSNRVAILKSLKTLIQNVLGGSGQVYIADADLSDISIDYLLTLSGVDLEPFIIENDWKPNIDGSWQIHNYTDSTPKRLVRELEAHIAQGGKPFVCLSAQKPKSQWGTCTLEAYLKKQFPDLRILRIDSESLGETSHPAMGCINNLNNVLGEYDIVLASPAIETGVSIDLRGHFTSVWCIAQGVQGENSVRQTLGRIRENLPRFIWVAPYGFNQVGNGSTSLSSLLASGQRLTQMNIRLLQQSDFDAVDDLDTGFQAESLMCWAKMAVRFNAAMVNYRESVLAGLRAEGHLVMDVSPASSTKAGKKKSKGSPQAEELGAQNALMAAITAVRDQNYQAECNAIASSQDFSDSQYQKISKCLVKTPSERRSLRKYDLKQRYGIPVTPELVLKDDQGWYQQLRLHYFLTIGRQHLAERDAKVARLLIEQGQGSIFLPDFNRAVLGAMIGTMKVLGIPILLENLERELKNTDQDLQQMAAIALANRCAIKTITGIGLAKKATPIVIIRRFLDKIGYGLQCIRYQSQGKKRFRVYQLVSPEDGRMEVFQSWLASDGQRLGTSEIWLDNDLSPRSGNTQSVDSENSNYVQLCLNV